MKKQTEHQTFPPVVAVLGHVDHGKTTLLDSIRKTSVAQGEHGGITQRIGASSIEIVHEGKKRRITFIDTPGHEAFAKMRSRGALAADIGLLIVSSVDGVMPQTKESMVLLKSAQIPFIVVFTKSDLPEGQIEKVKQQVIKEDILLEGLGGDVPYIEVSAKTNKNIKELLELILLVSDVQGKTTVSAQGPLKGIVIESSLDLRIGPKATVVIKNGTLHVRDKLSSEGTFARVRSLINDVGKQVSQASVGQAVELLGFDKTPSVGSIVVAKGGEAFEKVAQTLPASEQGPLHIDEGKLAILIAADTVGSLEAITNALPKENLYIIQEKTGEITEADVLLAKSIGAIVLGFNTKIRPAIAHLASVEKVLVKNYTIIYELLSEINDVIEGKQLAVVERVFGKASVLASFPYEKTKVAGVKVVEGRVAKGDKVRVMRGEDIVGEATITSVRQGKNPISKVEKGQEAGIILSPQLDFTIGDVVICHG